MSQHSAFISLLYISTFLHLPYIMLFPHSLSFSCLRYSRSKTSTFSSTSLPQVPGLTEARVQNETAPERVKTAPVLSPTGAGYWKHSSCTSCFLSAAGLAALLQVRFTLLPSARLPVRLTLTNTFTGASLQKSETAVTTHSGVNCIYYTS